MTGLEAPGFREGSSSCPPWGRCSSFCWKHLAKGLPRGSSSGQGWPTGLVLSLPFCLGGGRGVFLGRGGFTSWSPVEEGASPARRVGQSQGRLTQRPKRDWVLHRQSGCGAHSDSQVPTVRQSSRRSMWRGPWRRGLWTTSAQPAGQDVGQQAREEPGESPRLS